MLNTFHISPICGRGREGDEGERYIYIERERERGGRGRKRGEVGHEEGENRSKGIISFIH